MHTTEITATQIGLGSLPYAQPAGRDLTVTVGDIVPADPAVWPAHRLEAAFRSLADNLWRAMLAAPHFNSLAANDCTGAACAAVEHLERRGVQAMAISAVLAIADLRKSDDRRDMELGADLPHEEGEGRHIVVLIREGHRRWLLETALWQAHRPRFPAMPDLALVQVARAEPVCGLKAIMANHANRLMAARFIGDVEHQAQIGWFDKRHRHQWERGELASPARAKVVADILDGLN